MGYIISIVYQSERVAEGVEPGLETVEGVIPWLAESALTDWNRRALDAHCS